MVKKQQRLWRPKLVNFFGGFGYVMVVIQWVLAIALFVPLIEQLSILLPSSVEVVEPTVQTVDQPGSPSIFTFIGLAALVTIMVGVTAYISVKMPSTIAKLSKRAVHKSSDALTSAVLRAKHQKDTKKRRERLAPQIILWLKGVTIVLPVALSYVARFQPETVLDNNLAVPMAVVFAGISITIFALQYGLARALGVKQKELW